MKYAGKIVFIGVLVCCLVFPTAVVSSTQAVDGCWLAEIQGVRVLHLEGDPYVMGYMHGVLLHDEIMENFRGLIQVSIQRGDDVEFLLEVWDQVEGFIPDEYIVEMQGLADALNVSVAWVGAVHMIPTFFHCSSFSAWGSATVDGTLVHARSLDFPLSIKDPEAGTYLQDNAVLIIRKPLGGCASLDPSFAGFVGSLGGFNEKGIVTGVLSCWSHDETFLGIPMVFRQRMILDTAETMSEALQIIDLNKTNGWNFIISDAKVPVGYAVEQTANTSYMGTWDDGTEANPPFYQIPCVVRRTNIFIDTTTAATQRSWYNPCVFPLLGYVSGLSRLGLSIVPSFIPWTHYSVLSEAILERSGSLDVSRGMNILRDVYQGKNSMLFGLFVRLNFYQGLHQWVIDPSSGEFLISFAQGKNDAFDEPVHAFNFYELLEYSP